MGKYLALLRGINVGGKNIVPMAKLAEIFTALGFDGVRTYINSGNVLFATKKTARPALTGTIEQALEAALGFPVAVVMCDATSILELCRAIPSDWTNDTGHRTDILFLRDGLDAEDAARDLAANPAVDTLIALPGAIVWHVARADYNKSAMRKFIGTPLYKNMTARNVNTVRKLGEMLAPPSTIASSL